MYTHSRVHDCAGGGGAGGSSPVPQQNGHWSGIELGLPISRQRILNETVHQLGSPDDEAGMPFVKWNEMSRSFLHGRWGPWGWDNGHGHVQIGDVLALRFRSLSRIGLSPQPSGET
ncbi:hypothetical protein SCLCIDRAFT_1224345 [Scleroderma citrinum Foug A]|uniref:Uncharacterized protein n=1 Tax=Scleroderma citrinum Foug A TaxID=1036808 RepID=A0A0C3CSQ5_9AGAM|nr:hypothetical protein SCLCIDRAFT_1224345 [Scleroderma citrinum Foug A]